MLAAATVYAPHARADGYDDMFAAVDWLAHKYGVYVYTGSMPLPYDTYAATSGNTIMFNSLYTDDPALLRAHLTEDVMAGYHHGVNCSPEQLVAAHEFAHVLDNLTGQTARTELSNALANGFDGEVSGYAVTSIPEAIAEAFTAVECDVPTPAEETIYRMLTT